MKKDKSTNMFSRTIYNIGSIFRWTAHKLFFRHSDGVWWIPDHFSSAMKNSSFFKFLIFTESASLTHSLCFGDKLTLPLAVRLGD